MSFLIDTDVISELRKRNRVDEGVEQWFSSSSLFLNQPRLRQRVGRMASAWQALGPEA